MYYIEDRGVIVAREEEIFEKTEYSHIQEFINNHPSPDIHEPEYGEHILVFKVLKTYEGKNEILDDLLYVDLLCLCAVEIIVGDGIGCVSVSDLSHHEQLQKIRAKYPEFNIPKYTAFPKYLDQYGNRIYTIIPVRFNHQLGFIGEFEE